MLARGTGRREEGREKRRGGRNAGRTGRKVKVGCQEQSAGTTLPRGKAGTGRPQTAQDRPAGPGRKGTLSRACCARGRLVPQVREGTSRSTAVLGRQA